MGKVNKHNKKKSTKGKLSKEGERELFIKAKAGDVKAMSLLMASKKELINSIVRKYYGLKSLKTKEDKINMKQENQPEIFCDGDSGFVKAVRRVRIDELNTFNSCLDINIKSEIMGSSKDRKKHRQTTSILKPLGSDGEHEDDGLTLEDKYASINDLKSTEAKITFAPISKLLLPEQRKAISLLRGLEDGTPRTETEAAFEMGISLEEFRDIVDKARKIIQLVYSSVHLEDEIKKTIKGKKCLVVDDNGDLIDRIKKILSTYNVTVFSKKTVESALEFILQGEKMKDISWVILDLKLPYKMEDGEKILLNIWTDDNLKHVPVIILSSLLNDTDEKVKVRIDKLTRYGAIRCLGKGELMHTSLINAIFDVMRRDVGKIKGVKAKEMEELEEPAILDASKGILKVENIGNRKKRASWKGKCLDLTQTECGLLYELIIGKEEAVSHNVLGKVFENTGSSTENAKDKIKSHITKLRKKIESDGTDFTIRSNRDVGYYLTEYHKLEMPKGTLLVERVRNRVKWKKKFLNLTQIESGFLWELTKVGKEIVVPYNVFREVFISMDINENNIRKIDAFMKNLINKLETTDVGIKIELKPATGYYIKY